MRLGLVPDSETRRVFSPETDTEDCTSSSESDSSSDGDDIFDETLVVAVIDRVPHEPDLPKTTTRTKPYMLSAEADLGLLRTKLLRLPEAEQAEIVGMLRDLNVVAWSFDDLRPAEVNVKHFFELTDNTPIHHPVCRLAPKHSDFVRKELNTMLNAGIITPASSAWSFPVEIATKKDGKPRFCVDYRTLNQRMKPVQFPMPKPEEIFEELVGSTVFITLDLFSGYWQV